MGSVFVFFLASIVTLRITRAIGQLVLRRMQAFVSLPPGRPTKSIRRRDWLGLALGSSVAILISGLQVLGYCAETYNLSAVGPEHKVVFPNMPEEVFDAWIAPNIEEYEWPFSSPYDPVEGTRWHEWFAGHPLSFWGVTGKWRKTEFEYSDEILESQSQFRTTQIIQHCYLGFKTTRSAFYKTEERFQSAADYIKDHGKIPGFLVAMQKPEGLDIYDGHHRIAAFRIYGAGGVNIPAWLVG